MFRLRLYLYSFLLICLISCLPPVVAGGLAGQESPSSTSVFSEKIHLTSEEQAFLAAHPVIRLGSCEDWSPFVARQVSGEIDGFDADVLEYINAVTGAKIELVVGGWDEMVSQATARKIDGLATSAPTQERAEHFLFSSSYFTGYPVVAVAAQSSSDVSSLDDLQGKTVAIQAQHSFYKTILASFPQIKVVEAADELAAASLVVEGRADAVVLGTLGYNRLKLHLPGQLKIAHVLEEHAVQIVYSIRKDWPHLVSIIDKALAAMPLQHSMELTRRWFGVPVLKDKGLLPLSAAEREWLAKKHPVRVRISDYPPYFFYDGQGQPAGISVDYLNQIAARAGFDVVYVSGPSWPESLVALRERRDIDLLPTATVSEERRSFLAFTQEYLQAPSVIFTRQDSAFVGSIEDLQGKAIVVERDFVVHSRLERDWPKIRVLPVNGVSPDYDATSEALRTLAAGQGDAYIGNLLAGAYRIKRLGLENLKVAAPSPFGVNNQAMAVRSDWPELASIIDKTLDRLPPEKHQEIISRWMAPVRYEHGLSFLDLFAWVGVSSALLLTVTLMVVIVYRKAMAVLEDRVHQRTADLEQANRELAQSNYDLETFCYSVSHDLRAPLRGISGHAGMLEEKYLGEKSPQVSRHLAEIRNSAGLMGQLIDDLLAYSRVANSSGASEEVDLSGLVMECWQLLEGERQGREVDLRLEELPHCIGYRAILKQLLFNLLSNGIKYTRDNPQAVITIGSKMDNGVVAYFIQDNGIGFDMRYSDKLFRVFNRLHHETFEGTGIGLALCKRIVERHGGRIWGEGVPQKGAIFFFTLNEGLPPSSCDLKLRADRLSSH